jgi:putative hydrolase of the HAD superfamily
MVSCLRDYIEKDGTVIKAILFDLGGVLVPIEFSRAYARLAVLAGLQPTEVQQRLANFELGPKFDRGLCTEEEYISGINSLFTLALTRPEFEALWCSILVPSEIVPEPLIASLRPQFRLIGVSDTNPIHFAAVRDRYPAVQHFSGFALSYEVRATKPTPDIYLAAVRLAQCSPAECLYIDDIERHVEGARRCGLSAMRFVGMPQFEGELRNAINGAR